MESETVGPARLYLGDCLEILPTLDENSIDTCITDPPYGYTFMGKNWDRGVPGVRFWEEVLQVLKPGATLLAFGGTRTFHRLACAIEDAGFEIRDTIMWVYGSGFPKGHDISKAIDKAAGAKRKAIGIAKGMGKQNPEWNGTAAGRKENSLRSEYTMTAPATDAAKLWDGWNVALKPAWEPIIVAMKPRDGTFANNALKWGVAGLWIDGARVPLNGETLSFTHSERTSRSAGIMGEPSSVRKGQIWVNAEGRWPANLIHDGSEEVLVLFPQTKTGKAIRHKSGGNTFGGDKPKPPLEDMGYPDAGSAARFFYCAKASKAERDAGLESRNHHPTVKPLALMEYLCHLTKTPTGGVVLDPFMGSGTTGVAAIRIGRDFIGIEIDSEYLEIAKARIRHANEEVRQMELGL